MYAWVVANHALGSLGGDPWETTGIIELGGASAQVFSFSLSENPLGVQIFVLHCAGISIWFSYVIQCSLSCSLIKQWGSNSNDSYTIPL